MHISFSRYQVQKYSFTVSENIWKELELEPEPKLWTTVEPEPKINNFGPATL